MARGAMDLESLDAWLGRTKPASKVDGVSMLDGYLAAIVVGPCAIPPEEWFADLLGVNGHIGSAHGKQLDAIMAIAARFNAIGEILSTTPAKYAPIFHRTDNGVVFAGPWCMGFLKAMQLRWDDWDPLRNTDRIEYGLLLPILLHCASEFGLPAPGPRLEGPDIEAFLKTAYHDIPRVVPAIREFWMPQRLAEIR
jgi:uncharacterized protein